MDSEIKSKKYRAPESSSLRAESYTDTRWYLPASTGRTKTDGAEIEASDDREERSSKPLKGSAGTNSHPKAKFQNHTFEVRTPMSVSSPELPEEQPKKLLYSRKEAATLLSL